MKKSILLLFVVGGILVFTGVFFFSSLGGMLKEESRKYFEVEHPQPLLKIMQDEDGVFLVDREGKGMNYNVRYKLHKLTLDSARQYWKLTNQTQLSRSDRQSFSIPVVESEEAAQEVLPFWNALADPNREVHFFRDSSTISPSVMDYLIVLSPQGDSAWCREEYHHTE